VFKLVNEVSLYNKVSNTIYKFNATDAPFLIDDGSIDWGTIQTTRNTFTYPTQIGQHISSIIIGTRDISIFGWIVADNQDYEDLKNKKTLLNSFINPLQELEIRTDDYKITGIPIAQVKYSNTYNENNDMFCKFLINIFCANPMFEVLNPIKLIASDIQPKFMFPLQFVRPGITFGIRESSLFTTFTNNGTIPIGFIATLTANGTVNNPKLYNVNTQEFIQIDTVLNSGDVVTISTVDGDRYVKAIINDVEQNYFGYLDLDSSWLQLPIGDTIIGFKTYDSNGVEDLTYKNLSLSMEYTPKVFNLEEE
jgi:hypothetical protein